MAASAIDRASRLFFAMALTEDHDDFQDVLRQFLLERWRIALVDDHDLNALQFTQRKFQFRAQAQQSILVREYQPSNRPCENRIQQLLQARLCCR